MATYDPTTFWIAFLVFAVGLAAIGAWIGSTKGRTGEGLVWGLLLGIIGIIVIACRKPTQEHLIAKQRSAMEINNIAYQQLFGGPPPAPAPPTL
jgi:hypothetical protein